MRPGPNSSKFVVALVTALALVATACGGGSEQPTQIVNSEGLAATGWGSPAVPETDQAAPPDVDEADPGRSFGSPSEPDAVSPSVLAYVIENSSGVSYSFEQGIAMTMSLDGTFLKIDPNAPIATGEVDGSSSHIEVDIAPFIESTFRALKVDLDAPAFTDVLGAFDGAEFDIWTEGDVITLDMADYVTAAELLAPGSMSGLPGLGSGPVSIDLSELENIDPWSMGAALGNTQIIDPSSLIESLRDVDSVSEIGTDSVAGRAVTVYSGSLTMADYYAAVGQDLDKTLAEIETLLPASGTSVEFDTDEMRELMAGIDVNITAMVDEQGMLRRVEFVLNMSELMGAWSGGSALPRVSVGVWLEFDNYGQSFNIEAPDALDITASFESLFGDIVAV